MSIHSTGLSDCEGAPLVVKPRKACMLLDCGLTHVYKLIADGDLESFLDGRSRKITVESIRKHIRRRAALAAAPAEKRVEILGTVLLRGMPIACLRDPFEAAWALEALRREFAISEQDIEAAMRRAGIDVNALDRLTDWALAAGHVYDPSSRH
jgi:excisionase family DNA binding protein